MSDRISVVLHNAQQAAPVLKNDVWPWIKAMLMAGHGLVIEVKRKTRSAEQNARLHAMLGEIAARVEWAGKKRDIETWKRLLTAAWLRQRGEHVEMLPAIDGHGVDIVFRHTSTLTTAECGELMEFIEAWAAVEAA